MANVATVAIEADNRAIVMSRAELEKLAQSGTVAGEKIKAALAGVSPIAQTVADRAKQVNATFTQFEQNQARVNGVTAAIDRMRAAVEQVKANAMAAQIVLNDPFQKAEQSANRATAAIERMRASLRNMQANAMAAQIGARDPFQSGFPAAPTATPNLAASTEGLEQLGRAAQAVGVQFGGVGQGLAMAGRAAGEGVAALRAYMTQAEATARASGALTATQARLAAVSKVANAAMSFFGGPVGLAVIGSILAAKAAWDFFVRSQERAVEAAEKNIEVQTRLADQLRSQTAARLDFERANASALANLEAFRRGGESELRAQQDRDRAFTEARRVFLERTGTNKNISDELLRQQTFFQTILRQTETRIARERTLADAVEANRKAEEGRKAAIAAEVDAQRDYAVLTGRLTESQRAINELREQYVANLIAANVPAALRNKLEKEYVDMLEQNAKLTENQRRAGIAAQLALTQRQIAEDTRDAWLDAFASIATGGESIFDSLIGMATTLADQAHRAAQAVADAANNASGARPGVPGIGGALFQVASPSVAPIVAFFGTIVSSIFSASGQADEARERLRRALDDWNDDLDRFVRDLAHTNDPLQQELDRLQDWYDAQLKAIQDAYDQLTNIEQAGRRSASRLGGFGGFGARDFWRNLPTQSTDEYTDAVAELDEAMRQATEAAKAAAEAERVRTIQSLQAQIARAQGNDALATQIERQLLIADITDKQTLQLYKQLFAAEDAALAMEKLTDNIGDLRNVMESLQEFRDRLVLGPLSPLSPIQQLAEARRQFETMAALALAGDRTAAASLSGSGTSFLEASRGVNASSFGYVADFQRVQAIIEQVQGRFAGELSLEEQSLNELKSQTKTLADAINSQGNAQVAATVGVGEAVASLGPAIEELREELEEIKLSITRGAEMVSSK